MFKEKPEVKLEEPRREAQLERKGTQGPTKGKRQGRKKTVVEQQSASSGGYDVRTAGDKLLEDVKNDSAKAQTDEHNTREAVRRVHGMINGESRSAWNKLTVLSCREFVSSGQLGHKVNLAERCVNTDPESLLLHS